jgi:hypothetical protein
VRCADLELAIRERPAAAESDRADYQRDLVISYEHVAAFAELDERTNVRTMRACGQTRYVDLRAAAASELARADCQIHIVNNLMNMARNTDGTPRAPLERAASILRRLDAEGRLAPAERWKMDELPRRSQPFRDPRLAEFWPPGTRGLRC